MGLLDKIAQSNTTKRNDILQVEFTLEEAQMLLSLIGKSEFKGSDLQKVYNLASKLQQVYLDLKENR